MATYPEHRRKGYVNSLMKKSLEEMRDNGDIVSFLHPFDIHFYRRFGWEVISDYRTIQIEKKDLKPVGNQPGRIMRYKEESHSFEIEEVYEKYAIRHSAMLTRDASWWQSSIYGSQTAAVYYNALDEATGYLLYEVKDQVMKVEEFVPLDHEARVALWNYICQHDSMVDRVEMRLSVHEPFPYFLTSPKLKTEIFPYFMGRIVNAEKALETYPFINGSNNVFLHLEDTVAPWNNGTFLIGQEEIKFFPVKEGSACVKPPERGLQLNINALTVILFGYKRPMELYEMDMIKGTLKEVEELEKKIPRFKPFFYDFF